MISMRCFLLLIPLLVACSSARSDRSDMLDPILSPSQVNANPERFDGQRIAVRGLVLLSSNSHSLYESRELLDEFKRRIGSEEDFGPAQFEEYDKYCLTIANPRKLFDDPSRYRGHVVVFYGTFVKDFLSEDVIDLGACQTVVAPVIE